MINMNATGVFCGDGALLIQCAEVFQASGGRIVGVISGDARVSSWAEAGGLPLLGTPEAPATDGVAFDFLFSIANLTVLPAGLLARAGRMAINFHDGPLPARAGLNAPAWAMIEGAERHAITWHEMTEKVDAGGALIEREFEIRPDDTAFSLNARCYEAGFDGFRALLADLANGAARARPLSGERGWYARARRPEALGALSPSRPAAELSRLARALDFGGYVNPLAMAKLWTGERMLAVGKAEPAQAAAAMPGTLMEVSAEGLVMRVGDGGLRLSRLTDMAGDPVDPVALGLVCGQVLPAPVFPDAPAPDAIGRDEPFWRAALTASAGAALPPYPMAYAERAGAPEAADLDLGGATGDQIAAAYCAWIAGMTGTGRVSVAFRGAAPAAPWLSDLRLVGLSPAGLANPAALIDALRAARAEADRRAPMARDLPLRLAHADERRQALASLSVVIAETGADAEILGEASLAIALDHPRVIAKPGLFESGALTRIAADFSRFVKLFAANPAADLSGLPLGAPASLARRGDAFRGDICVSAMIAETARRAPGVPALEAGAVKLDFAGLEARVATLAGALAARGVERGAVVGLCLERSADLVVGMLAILRLGAAYLPLDPAYPAERIAYMIEDSGGPLVLTRPEIASRLGIDPAVTVNPGATGPAISTPRGGPDDLAYLIYTSGSTGKPKGVMVGHRNVMNFFAGMDEAVPLAPGARFLAVTSISFDISVLEILWTLSRGATLVLQTEESEKGETPDFSLFYFASEASGSGHHAYRLLLEGARFADENGFSAIWTPERHFHAFGGLYPNPAISAAAVAGITRNIKLRAGSSVAPLHHPVRVAEDWALVDNLSNGRAGVAIASGWQPNDFILRPDAFGRRKEVMLETVETLRRLWRGEKMEFPGHDGKPVEIEIHPKPMQAEIPLWLTAAGNPETFAAAARLGCGVLTHLLGQSFEEVAEKIRAYRAAWREAGHPGEGNVVLMLHTFVGEDDETVREVARGPMKGYLKSAVDLVKRASWTFPTIVQRAEAKGVSPAEMFEQEELSAEDLDQLLDHAFERYYQSSGLFGTPESARETARRVAEIGVDEIACLIDFGIDTDIVLENLPHLKVLMDGLAAEGGVSRKASVADEIAARGITHLQCTPSQAAMLAADTAGQGALGRLDCLMVGGEALPLDLAHALRGAVKGAFLNMYGPTETTIWSSVARLDHIGERVPLGAPIANTALSVRGPDGRALPDMVEGELWIGGEGVTHGYWRRPELTAERFVETDEGRFYRTGDLVRANGAGTLDFLGRIDNQVKIRGHRIELGEIEAALAADASVGQAVVRAVELGENDNRLIGYVTPARAGAAPEAGALREALAAHLPEFMVPAQVMVLDRMPLTPNGKIDRKALPSPASAATAEPAAPVEGATEDLIAGIWREALGLAEVSATASFFDLGGHSLLVVQVQRRLKEALKRDVSITDLFRFPTIRALAGHLAAQSDERGDDAPSVASRAAARAAARLAMRTGRR
ncbi:MAG: MupA/Atu3671 family FMN-dependent luciferase-like monooxygenase [Pikeienuella sp.]